MPGTRFKLLNVNPITGGFSYGEDHGNTGNCVFEGAGIRHEPVTHAAGLIMFAVANGPLCGYKHDGSVAGIVDARLMYDMAAAAADHVEKPSHWV